MSICSPEQFGFVSLGNFQPSAILVHGKPELHHKLEQRSQHHIGLQRLVGSQLECCLLYLGQFCRQCSCYMVLKKRKLDSMMFVQRLKTGLRPRPARFLSISQDPLRIDQRQIVATLMPSYRQLEPGSSCP